MRIDSRRRGPAPARLARAGLAAALLAPAAVPATLAAQDADPALAQTIAALPWRNIGPANMAGRIVDVEGIASPSATFYVVTAAGGVWKTTNNGTTFFPVLDTARVASGGDLAIAPSDTNVVYVGMGEPNSRNSISPGGGVYKSTDGGKSWTSVGLGDVRAFGRIQVHPTNPDVAYVAGLGHPWGPNKERGLFKTTDGGKSWRTVKYIDDKTGFNDVQLDPRNPDVVWAASYQRVRGPYFYAGGGPGSGLWKSTDGGETWTEVTGGGLPPGQKGRIEIAISRSQPDIMYLMVEADTAPNPKPEKGAAPQTRPSGLYRSDDGGKTWEYRNPSNVRPFYYSQVRVHPTNPDVVYWSSTPVKYSRDGGKTAGNATQGIHVDHHAMWFDPANPDRFIMGNDGGVSITYDGGGNYHFLNVFAIGQFYNISYGMEVPYTVCGGLQDNGSWCGPSRRRNGDITNAMWHNVGGGDGFGTAQDPVDHHLIYATSQGGNIGRMDFRTGTRSSLRKPDWRERWLAWEDSIVLAGDDQRRVRALRAAQKADSAAYDLRYNWNTPYFLSPHNPKVVYVGANRVLKSTMMGDGLYPISPDLTYADTMKIRVSSTTTGGITPDVTGAERFATIVALAESPRQPGVLYAGTDDGRLWVTRNDGGDWTELTANVKGVPAGTYVSRIEPSHHADGTVYVTYDNHRRDDYAPYVVASTDFGRSFRSITANLPSGEVDYVHVIREDPHNADLLFVGTDVGVYVSVDRGGSWHRFMTGLPTVPVNDLRIHPRDHELIAGTHGRSIWIADILPLEQHSATVASADRHLYEPRTAMQWGESPVNGGNPGHHIFQGESAEYGADVWYRLGKDAGGPVRLVVQDAMGDTLATINGARRAGVHRASWNFRGKMPPSPPLSPAARRDSAEQAAKVGAVLDSLEKAGTFPSGMINMARRSLAAGPQGMMDMMRQFGGFGGGGRRGGAGAVAGRPGESAPTPSFPPARGAGAAAGRGPGGGGQPDAGRMQELFGALREALGSNFNPFRGRGPQAPLVGSGDYKVTLVTPDGAVSRMLRVERTSGDATEGSPFAEDELARAFDRWVTGESEGEEDGER